jgi:steroid delta-isomerase-like uncharacterized protein
MLSPKAVLKKWADCMSSHDLDSLLSLYHDDAINLQVAIGTPLQGKEAIRSDFIDFFTNIPDTFTTIENLFEDGEWAIIEWSGGGTFTPTGKKFTLRGCGFFRVIDGTIRYQRGYWDKATWMGQIGMPLD